jgi:flagellin-like protein
MTAPYVLSGGETYLPARRSATRMLRRSRIRSPRGLAEIVGTLMLVLIVVSAAVAFSFFVASYQAQLQGTEAATHAKSLEVLNTLGLQTHPIAPGSLSFGWLNFTVSSGTVESEWISGILVNGNPVKSFNASDPAVNSTAKITVGLLPAPIDNNTTLYVAPLAEVTIYLDLHAYNAATNPWFSFFDPSQVPVASSFLVLTFETTRGNSFTATYVPPTALADVTYVQSMTGSSSTVSYPLLDGTRSFQEGENATIVGWEWNITEWGGGKGTYFLEGGAEVELTSLTATDTYSANVTVYDSIGLFAVSLNVTFAG